MSPADSARLHLSIGVTAHRDLVAAEEPALREAVRGFFAYLRSALPDLPLRVISALAEGGDQLVAEEALAQGIELVAALPMPQREYERDFADAGLLARFRALLERAAVRELPFAPGVTIDDVAMPGPARDRQYAQLGMFVSSHCQVLLALWDGRPGLAGGTAEVVEYHVHNTMPALSVEQVAPGLLADDESDLVFHLCCSRRSVAAPPPAPLATRWLTIAGDRPGDDGIPEQHLRVFRQMSGFNHDLERHACAIDAAPSQLFEPPLPGPAPPRVAAMERRFHAADWLAVHFQKRVRGSLLATHAIAALMGLAFVLFNDFGAGRGWLVLFLLLFGLGILLAMLSDRREWQRRYLDYRGLAEGLRVRVYWALAGVEVPADTSLGYESFLQKQDTELSWIRHAMRGAGLLRDEGSRPDRAWLEWTVARWVGDADGRGGQLEYFRRGGARRERAFHETERVGRFAMLGGLAIAALLVASGGAFAQALERVLLVAMGLLPLLAGIRESYSYKKADKELIRQFKFMARLFESTRVRLAQARGDAEVRRLLLALGRACLEEHAEWILLHRERPLESAQLG
jgi:hypothetical protein